MTASRTVDLFCWPAKDTLHSFSPECLTVLAYSQFSKASVKPNKCIGYQQYKATLPVVYDGDKRIEGMQPVLTFMRGCGWNADYWLNEKQQADTLAFEALVEEKLQPAILHLQFINMKNFTECVRGFYADSCSFPWNFYIPGQLQKGAKRTLSILHRTSDKNIELPDSSLQKKVVTEARHCINLLSNFLDDRLFLFGDRPTTLDAILYGYMAFLLKSNLPNNVLFLHVRECQNLTRFVARVDDQFMNSMPKVSTTAAEVAIPKSRMTEDQKMRLKKWASIGFGLAAMVAYALLSGIIAITVEDDPDSDYVNLTVKERHDLDIDGCQQNEEQPIE